MDIQIDSSLDDVDWEAAKAALAESTYGSAEALPEITMYYNSNDSANTARAEWVAGQYKEILGVHMIGPRATELVAEAGVALRLECTVEELIRTIHAHPTMSEAVGEAAHAVHGAAIHL